MSIAQILILSALVVFGGLFALFAIARRAYLAEYRKAFPDPVIPQAKPLSTRLDGWHGAYDPREQETDYARMQAIRLNLSRERAKMQEWS